MKWIDSFLLIITLHVVTIVSFFNGFPAGQASEYQLKLFVSYSGWIVKLLFMVEKARHSSS